MPTLTLPPLASAVGALFRAASHVRGERAIHARGRAFAGRLSVTGGAGTGADLLDAPGTYDVVVRLSRSVGLPQPSPDILGFALRVVDAYGAGRHQDLMLDSASPAPVLRRLRFHPSNTGGGLELAGPMQEWRRRSYDATHVGADA